MQVKVKVCGNKANETMSNGRARWPVGTVVKYAESLQFAGLDRAAVSAAYDKACAQWSAVAGIRFERVSDPTTANIVAGDGIIDGPYGILAESELPYSADAASRMSQTFDQSEPWSQEGIDLLVACMCHEIGHAIGLEHLPGTGALMEPIIVPGRSAPQAADIAEAQARYGRPSTVEDPVDFAKLGNALAPYVLGPFADGLMAAAVALESGAVGTDAEKVRTSKEDGLRQSAWDYYVTPRLAPLDPGSRAQAYRELAAGVAARMA